MVESRWPDTPKVARETFPGSNSYRTTRPDCESARYTMIVRRRYAADDGLWQGVLELRLKPMKRLTPSRCRQRGRRAKAGFPVAMIWRESERYTTSQLLRAMLCFGFMRRWLGERCQSAREAQESGMAGGCADQTCHVPFHRLFGF